MEAHMKVDETSCGPFCQHPYCWYSNRRVERGLPHRRHSTDAENQVLPDEELPTLKIRNLLEDYGSDPGDRYPSQQPLPRRRLMLSKEEAEQQARSLSAPIARNATNGPPQVLTDIPQKTTPMTPHQTPMYSRQGPQGHVAPSRTNNKSAPARSAPFTYQELGSRVNKVDMQDALQFGQMKHQGVTPGGKMYIWCPSGKEETDRPDQSKDQSVSQTKVHPKDVTQDMLPQNFAATQDKTKKQKKKEPSHQTPTGGRPYTHPARSPPPVTRRTLPQDFDEGIAQLLQLPREVLLEILEHTKESDLYDKSKVSLLLEKLMPLIRFDQEDAPHYPPPVSPVSMQLSSQAPVPPAPLYSSGILRQKKVTLLEGRQKRADPLRAPPPTRSMPFFMDDSALSMITSSSYTRRERPDPAGDEDRETTMPTPTVASEDFIKRKSIAPIRGGPTEMSNYSRRKVTSVSAKTLPPLQPGARPIRPFNYTAQSFDLALSPLSTPDYQASEKPSSPYSGRASTVYVTVPSILSDHTPPASPASCERTPIPPITRQSSAHYSNISSAPSDDFNAAHRSTPRAPPEGFRAVYTTGTGVKPDRMQREDLTQSGVSKPVGNVDTGLPSNVPSDTPMDTPSVAPTTHASTDDAGERSLKERPVHTASTDTRDPSLHATPMRPAESASPYDASTSVMAQASDKAAGSPMPLVTPLPSMTSPEVWPMVDERDYMRSPERKIEMLANKKMEMILAPVAPPPSPEPTAMDVDYDIQEVANKSTAASSLTPLAEEEEDESDLREESMSAQAMEMNRMDTGVTDVNQAASGVNERDQIGTRSRGYLGDDEDGDPSGEGRLYTADSNEIKPSAGDSPGEEVLPGPSLEEEIENTRQVSKETIEVTKDSFADSDGKDHVHFEDSSEQPNENTPGNLE